MYFNRVRDEKEIVYPFSVVYNIKDLARSYKEAQTAIDMRKQDIVDGVSIENLRMERNGAYIALDMLWDLSGLDVDNNRAVLLTPWLVNGSDSLSLQSIGVYGRRRYYFVTEVQAYLRKLRSNKQF